MRALLILIPLMVLIAGCPRIRKGEVTSVAAATADPDFPAGYSGWEKANDETLIRSDDVVQVAREIYTNKTPGLQAGAILVKEEYSLSGGAKGALKRIAVMRRGTGPKNHGWEFMVFDGVTKKRGDASRCVGCHVLQEDNDYLFSAMSSL